MGKLVVVTGIDGCGKTTQINLLYKYLMTHGMKVLRESASISHLECYRDYKRVIERCNSNGIEVSLYEKSMILGFETYLKIKNILNVELEKNDFVLLDRYFESNEIYMQEKKVDTSLLNCMFSTFRQPDFYFCIDVDAETAYSRIIKRGKQIKKHENIKDLNKLRRLFLANKHHYGYEVIQGTECRGKILSRIIYMLEMENSEKIR